MKNQELFQYLIKDVESGMYDLSGYKRQYPKKHIFDSNLSNKANKELLKEKNKDIDFFNKELGKKQEKNQKNFYIRLQALVQDYYNLDEEEANKYIESIAAKKEDGKYVLSKEARRYETEVGKIILIKEIFNL